MYELLGLVQSLSIVGVIAGAFTMSWKSGLRNLWWICLLLCMGSTFLRTYWDEVFSFCTTAFTWVVLGAIALATVIVGIRLIRKFLFGKHG